jgi:hypothetical protein
MPDETWYVVYYSATGEAYSFGTSLADPMPAEFSAKPLSAADAESVNHGTGRWDAASRTVVPL